MLSGRVQSNGLNEVAVENGGTILRLLANVGDRVQAGQVLAVLDSQPARLQSAQASAQVAGLQASLDNARHEATRLEQLFSAGAASQQQVDEARSAARNAEAQTRAATAQAAIATRAVAKTIIRAPASGTVTSRNAALSAYVGAGSILFTIDAGGSREIEVSLPGTIARQARVGQGATFSFGGAEGTARIAAISSSVAGVDAQVARLSILSGDAPHGAAVDVRIGTGGDGSTGVTVPLSAVSTLRNGTRAVMVIDGNGRTSTVPVQVANVSSAGALVVGTIAPGQRVVAAGSELVRPGQTVRPLPFTS